jgi:hypothetical protein
LLAPGQQSACAREDVAAIWDNVAKAKEAAHASELLYYYNYDEHYTYGAKGQAITSQLTQLADQILAKTNTTATSVRQSNGPFPEDLRKLAQPANFVPWVKLTDVPLESSVEQSRFLLQTAIGLSHDPDFFCLGAVFTVQVWRNTGWQTVFRHALLKKDHGWQDWTIPLGPGADNESLRIRLVTDSYSRAHDRSWPKWNWAFWGEPKVELGQQGGKVDLCDAVPQASLFVVLDQNGLSRPFDARFEDSTGATFKAVAESEAERANAPLPARRCIAAFPPHRNAASGLTIAEFKIDQTGFAK